MLHVPLFKLFNWLLPCMCVLCGKKAHNNFNLCCACEQDLPCLKNRCVQCGRELGVSSLQRCGNCLQHAPPYDQTIALYHYQTPIDYLILGLKFGNRLINAKLLGILLALHLQRHYAAFDADDTNGENDSGDASGGVRMQRMSCAKQAAKFRENVRRAIKPEVIIPVPLHKARLRERGYNQALELARPVAHILQIPIDKHCCQRVKNTQAQSLLRAKERKQNIRGAFVVAETLSYKHVAVIDDVITTGYTIREFCGKLRCAGVQRIDVWSCAKT